MTDDAKNRLARAPEGAPYDVLTRLRDEAEIMGVFVDTEALVTTLTQAADEIERLRAEVGRLRRTRM